MEYKFTSEKFAISDEGFHLLRNEFNFKTYKLADLSAIRIRKGFDLKNWLFVLCLGVFLIGFAINDSITIYNIFNNPDGIIYIERFLIPIFPLALGGYSLIISLRRSAVMDLNLINEKKRFSLRKLDKLDKTGKLISFLKEINLRPKIEM